MVDDTLFLADLHSLSVAISKFKTLEQNSGLKLNINDIEIIPIGKLENKLATLPPELALITIVNGHFKFKFKIKIKICIGLTHICFYHYN